MLKISKPSILDTGVGVLWASLQLMTNPNLTDHQLRTCVNCICYQAHTVTFAEILIE